MSEDKGKSLSIERILLIIVSALLVITLGYFGVSALIRRGQEALPPEVVPVEPAEEQPVVALATEPLVVEPVVEPPVAEPTSAVQRLEVPPTPTPLVIFDEDDPRGKYLDLANPDHTDYFINPDTWYDYEVAGAAYSVQDGKLVGTDNVPQEGLYWSYTSVQSGRVYAEISATNGDCISKDAVGLVIRIDPEQTPSGYALEVSCDGAWRLIRFRSAGGATATQVDWTTSDVIRTGKDATNRLGIWGYDGKFYIS